MVPPPAQPQWTPPPQQPTGWGGPGYGGPPPRPTGVTLAAHLPDRDGHPDRPRWVAAQPLEAPHSAASAPEPTTAALSALIGGFIAGLGIFILILGIVSIVAGAGALGGKGWGRWIGIVISVIFAILLVLGGLGSVTSQNGMTSGVSSLVVGILYALTAYALICGRVVLRGARR